MGFDCNLPTTAECAELACIWEVRARKAGNVTPQQGFRDVSIEDFYRSAEAIAPILGQAEARPVGLTVWQAIVATRRVVATNTNLGIVLLLAPLAAVPRQQSLRLGVRSVLSGLTVADSRAVFAAIRLAYPGGLAVAPDHDVRQEPTLPLREIMALAQDYDLIAEQYVHGFTTVFDEGVPALLEGLEQLGFLEEAIIHCQLRLLARHPDSLIFRKRGASDAAEASRRARAVLDAGWPRSAAGRKAFAELDSWLRALGNQRNPGTTADLVTASLFTALRERMITLPVPYPWSR
ncbi:MAG: triphosphoribosyl-dephospho-CoA synthase [Gemmataceae bacterium]|nr:triphosphoribosyl-dephospho-CoA synthase [Gemmataceae bacterium]